MKNLDFKGLNEPIMMRFLILNPNTHKPLI